MNEIQIAEIIKRDCSKFLNESRGMPLYRKIENVNNTFHKFRVNQNRKPKDSTIEFHESFNTLFKKYYNVDRIRSRCLFASGSLIVVNEYPGNVFVVFPIGNYTYWGASGLEDSWGIVKYEMINDISDVDKYIFKKYTYRDDNLSYLLRGKDVDKYIFKKYTYRDDNLSYLLRGKNELMFLVEEYYAVPITIYRNLKKYF